MTHWPIDQRTDLIGRSKERKLLLTHLANQWAAVLEGPLGFGKTHLATAVATEWQQGAPGRRVIHSIFVEHLTIDAVILHFGQALEGSAFEQRSLSDRRRRAVELFHSHEVLWVWDDFHLSLTAPAPSNPTHREEEQRQVTAFLRALRSDESMGRLLILRDHGSELDALPVVKLSPLNQEARVQLAMALLAEAGAESTCPEEVLQSVLARSSGRPTDVHLLLPLLRDLTDGSALLHTSPDPATLCYQQLERRLKVMVHVFLKLKGGIFESLLLDWTEVLPGHWERMRDTLVAHRMLHIEEQVTFWEGPYLRFTPATALVLANLRLSENDEEEIGSYIDLYRQVADDLDTALSEGDHTFAASILSREGANLRHAVQWAFRHSEARAGQEISEVIAQSLEQSGLLRDRAAWLDWVEDNRPRSREDPFHITKARRQALQHVRHDNPQQALRDLKQIIEQRKTPRSPEHSRQRGLCHLAMAQLLTSLRRYPEASTSFAMAVQDLQAFGEPDEQIQALHGLSRALVALDRRSEAQAHARLALQISQAWGDASAIESALSHLADFEYEN